MNGKVTIILLNWNAAILTGHCLRRLRRWKRTAKHIMVVDNGSTDASVEAILSGYPEVEIIRNRENKGYSGGINSALREMMAEEDNDDSGYILLLNTDAFMEEESLGKLLDCLVTHPLTAVTAPVIYVAQGSEKILSAGGLDPASNVGTYWRGLTAEAKVGQTLQPYEVDYVSGTVALLRKSAIREVGLFDESYFFSCEMADLCERFKKAGYHCTVTPEATAWHEMQSEGGQRDTLYLYYSLRNRFLFIRKFRKKEALRLNTFWVWVTCKTVLKALVPFRPLTIRAALYALYHGLSGRYGRANHLFGKS